VRDILQHCAIRWCFPIMLWCAAVVTGFLLLMQYENTAGPVRAAPPQWPTASRVPRDPHRPTLICLLHPHCPCSRAASGELARILTLCADQVAVQVLFWSPADGDEHWARGGLWDAVAAIPGVTVRRDPGGVEARLLGAMTSTQALLYGADGKLLFRGGLTAARGQAGGHPGQDALVAWIKDGAAAVRETPVYGCPLQD